MTLSNWVKARFDCSLGELFENLKAEVKEDVTERERLLQPEKQAFCGFKFRASARTFSAYVEGNSIHESVDFTLEERWISVRKNGGDLILVVTAALDDEGRCVARIDGDDYERWQLRKLALDNLFFYVV
jgi:hypothetical protein